jgi:rRNA-processing protein FCF1
MKKKLLLDTNFLLVPLRYGINLTQELDKLGPFELLIPAEALLEIEKLKPAERRFALSLLDKLNPGVLFKSKKVINQLAYHEFSLAEAEISPAYCDDVILKQSKQAGLIIATLDKELIRKAKAQGCRAITLHTGQLKLLG